MEKQKEINPTKLIERYGHLECPDFDKALLTIAKTKKPNKKTRTKKYFL